MTADERRDRILLHAAGALDESEAAELRAEPEQPGDRAAQRDAEELLAHLALTADPVAPSPRAKERLFERVAAHEPAPRLLRKAPLWRELAAAGLVAAVSAGFAYAVAWQQLGSTARLAAAEHEAAEAREAQWATAEAARGELETLLEEQDREIAALEAQISSARDALGLLTAPGMVAIELVSAEGAGDVTARVFWDWEAYTCFFEASGLRTAEPGRAYVLWLVTVGGDVIRAGSFEGHDAGSTSFFALLPQDMDYIARVVVTDEPLPVGDAPTGATHLAADVPQGAARC